MPKKKIFAFIDSQNLNLGVYRAYRWKLDFARFRTYLTDKFHVEEAYLFIGYVPGNEALYTSLQEAGYILVLKPTLEHKEKGKTVIKGNVDAELVLHTVARWADYDSAIIVSGDGDYLCLIDYLAENDKLEKIIVPNQVSFSSLLKKHIDSVFFITKDMKDKIGMVKQKKNGMSAGQNPLPSHSS